MKNADFKSYTTYVSRGITPQYVNSEGFLVLNQKCIRNGQIDYSYARLTSKQKTYPEEKLLRNGDILINSTGTGTLGRIALFKGSDNKVLVDSHISIVRISEEYDTRFFAHYLYSKEAYIATLGKGATNQQELSKDAIYSIPVPSIARDKQSKIGDILSAYDDLIENNQKQIKLLEEAAMRLYKEWFVNLRFPGHEYTKIVDGVPERWKQGQLRDYIQVNPRSISKDYPHQVIQYIDIGSVSHGRIEQTKTYRLSDAPGRAKRLACDGDTIWGMVRPNLKAYALVLSPGENYVFSTGFAILSPKRIPYTFLYCLVTQDSFVGYLVNCTNGSAYPAVKPIHFEDAKVIIPDEGLLFKFHETVDPMFRKIKVIENQNSFLKEARDKLLPKLMNGEIEV